MDDKQEALDIPLTKQEPNEHEMAALVASAPIAPHALGKRAGGAYRPTPAKTFQCRGFGDCRMVFSRSEHLARHIRKHTGERPFACHCSKQFSRLDNLRQHAQTVHADKAEENEAMMRDLTSLHATMVASHKSGRRRAAPSTKARPGTATGTEGVASQPSLHSPTSPTFEDSSRNNRHSFAAPSPTSTLGPHSPQSPPGVRRTSPFSAQSPPQRPSTTSPFAPPPTSNPPPVPSPFQNPFAQERTTTPFTPYNNPFESPQQPPFVPPPVPGSSHEWDQPFVLGQPPLPSAKQRAQRPSIDTSTIHHPNKRTTPPPQSLDSRSPIQAPGPRRPLDSHLFPQSSHAQHLPVAHPPHRETTQWMSPTAGPVLPQADSQRWQEQQNSDYYHYPRAVQAQQELQQQPPPPPPSTTMVEEAFRLGVGLGLAIDPGSGEWPPEQVMEVDMVPGQDMEGGMYAWDDRPPPLSASSSMGTTQEETTSTWTPPSASMSKEILASDLTTIQTPPPSASTLTTQTNVQGVEGALPALYQHPLPPQTQMQGPPPHPDLTSPISPLAPPVPEKDRYRLELARQQLQQLYAQRGMRDEMAPLHSASQPAWSSVDGSQFHPLPPHAMYHPQQPPPAQQAPSSHHPMYGWMQNGY